MFIKREGERVPEVNFKIRKDGKFIEVSTEQIFKGKTVVLFSLPGAFTPTCSSAHLPRYNDLYSLFQENGVDEVVCLSVNDAFVMDAWSVEQGIENIKLIPDGNGEFTKGMGMLVDKSDLGFGQRSWRYSMLVKDGHIEKMFIEPDLPGDPFKVSDADTMLKYLNPKAKPKVAVTIFTKSGCPHCARAKELLRGKKLHFTEVEGLKTNALQGLGGSGTFPLIFVGGVKVGTANDLEKYLD